MILRGGCRLLIGGGLYPSPRGEVVKNNTGCQNLQRLRYLVLRLCWNFQLMKFCQNFGEMFGETFEEFRPPLPTPKKRNVRIFILCAVQTLHFCRNFDNTIGKFEFHGLILFNGGMFNCVQVIQLGLCDTNRI